MKSADFRSLGKLTDGALLAELHRVTRAHRGLTAELVAHLAEMEARKLHLREACSSLFAYCTERLGFSEDEACRRIEAARLARRFPCIYDRLETGRVSLSVLGRLKSVLTEENAQELLDAVSGKSVRETERVLAARFPKPDVADSIRKLPARPVASTPVASTPLASNVEQTSEPDPSPSTAPPAKREAPPRPADRGRVSPLSAERVLVKFTASRTLEEKLRLARDLMSHKNPSGDLATIVEAAVDLLIAERMKRKFGQTEHARKSQSAKPSRVTNATKRKVALRDGLRCTFVDARGRRCSARGFLELDHEQAKARGGSSGAENVRVLCHAHNQGEAERVFGRRYMERCRKKRDFTVRDGARATYVRRRPDAMTWFAGSRSGATSVRTLQGHPYSFLKPLEKKNSEVRTSTPPLRDTRRVGLPRVVTKRVALPVNPDFVPSL